MCGICGVFSPAGSAPVDRLRFLLMRDLMTHRGPDESGVHYDDSGAIGHRRLKIIDLVSGQQPMSDPDRLVWISYNGEVYNYRELRDGLKKKGYRFRSQSDTEVILNLYLDKGLGFVDHINGMFAIAIWDTRDKSLTLVRDRLGIRPLYYAQSAGQVLFASEIKAVLAYAPQLARLDSPVLGEYLRYRSISGDSTFYKDVKQVLPGQIIRFCASGVTKKLYWDIPHSAQDGLELSPERLEQLLADSIRLRLISDVPVGTFCSGGVDSSLISAMATRLRTEPIDTFSVGFNEPDFDERRYAMLASRHIGSRHHELVVNDAQYAELWPRMVWHMDEPINHAHSIQLYLVSKLAKSFVTVVLTGEGSDELFAGYPRYKIVYLLQKLQALPSGSRTLMKSLLGSLDSRRLSKISAVMTSDIADIIVRNSAFVQDETIWAIRGSMDEISVPYRRETALAPDNYLDSLLYLEAKTYLTSLLLRQDKMSMAASVESRVPFLDYRVVEAAFRMPASKRFPFGRNKALVKEIALRHLPREIITRKKSGFSVPIGLWLKNRSGLGRYLDLITDSTCRNRGLFDPKNTSRIVDEHLGCRADHGEVLWELINFELWHRIFIDRTVRV